MSVLVSMKASWELITWPHKENGAKANIFKNALEKMIHAYCEIMEKIYRTRDILVERPVTMGK